MAHTAERVTRSVQVHPIPLWVTLIVLGGGALGFHVVRALLVRERTSRRWVQVRGLPDDPRTLATITSYLARLRWSRVASTSLLILACTVAAMTSHGWISFASLPFVLSVLVAEALAPDPRRGRIRFAALDRRPRSYFAPVRALGVARGALAMGIVLSLIGLVTRSASRSAPIALHATVLIVGAISLEVCLQRISARALPDRGPDLAVDTAMRVASARTATAAGLVFAMSGLIFAIPSGLLPSHAPSWFSVAMGQVVTLAFVVTIGVAIALVQPLTSWRPRASR
jgi:hypothetical protein